MKLNDSGIPAALAAAVLFGTVTRKVALSAASRHGPHRPD